jgi:hypothetical protein
MDKKARDSPSLDSFKEFQKKIAASKQTHYSTTTQVLQQ